jgi:hypothetical protein
VQYPVQCVQFPARLEHNVSQARPIDPAGIIEYPIAPSPSQFVEHLAIVQQFVADRVGVDYRASEVGELTSNSRLARADSADDPDDRFFCGV